MPISWALTTVRSASNWPNMEDYWHKQTVDKPLYEDLLWSRPESKNTAGKLLIIGGNVHSFAAVGQAFEVATKAGAGSLRIVMPDSLQKTVGKLLPEADFATSTPSGSFSQKALAEWLEASAWADLVLIAGDLGRNSETAIVLEKFIEKYNGQLNITKDGIDYFIKSPKSLLSRPQTTLIVTMAQLQQMTNNSSSPLAFTFDIDLLQLVKKLHQFTTEHPANIIIKHLDTLLVATNGQVSTTKTNLKEEDSWRIAVATKASVWWLQNPSKAFEALSTSIIST